jgi:hypothetical protein
MRKKKEKRTDKKIKIENKMGTHTKRIKIKAKSIRKEETLTHWGRRNIIFREE